MKLTEFTIWLVFVAKLNMRALWSVEIEWTAIQKTTLKNPQTVDLKGKFQASAFPYWPRYRSINKAGPRSQFFPVKPRRLLLKRLGVGVRPTSQTLILFTTWPKLLYPIYDHCGWYSYPGTVTLPFGAPHTYIAHIRERPPPPTSGKDLTLG